MNHAGRWHWELHRKPPPSVPPAMSWKGLFKPWTHEVFPCQRAIFQCHIPMVRFLGNVFIFLSFFSLLKVFGFLTRCTLNVVKEKWPCTQKWMRWFFRYMFKKGNLGNFLHVWPSLLLLLPFSLVTMETFGRFYTLHTQHFYAMVP